MTPDEQIRGWATSDLEQAAAIDEFAGLADQDGNEPKAAQLRAQAAELRANADGWNLIASQLEPHLP